MKRLAVLLSALLLTLCISAQDSDKAVRSCISNYFSTYRNRVDIRDVTVRKVEIDRKRKTITITLSDNFSRQMFRPSLLDSISGGLKQAVPASVRNYEIRITSNGRDISTLVPNRHRLYADQSLMWNGIGHDGESWVRNESSAVRVRNGLAGVHLSVTPSHGYYYDNSVEGDEPMEWKWQRPSLWCTREDLLTQSFVYPYLIPMLENAGAVVVSTRERDWQNRCVIVDDDSGRRNFIQRNGRGRKWNRVGGGGYSAKESGFLSDNKGEVRIVGTSSGVSSEYAAVEWLADFPEEGQYAVYVTYRTFENSVSDARYTVYHKGGQTTFSVNQQMGGGTWLYLGTFHFDAGRSEKGMVILDNVSHSDGVVCADAVRFGGGMGDEPRGGTASGKPRYLEGARYYSRFSGAPDSVFLKYDGTHDYNEDIQARPRMTNWLAGGSVYDPDEDGLKVPIELSFALHTDAGVRLGDSIVGTLGICTTQKKDGILGTGMSRDVSRDLADEILDGIGRDISASTGREWTLRGVLDGNYCESREPQVPSALLELLSHQNFYDLKYAFDPKFRFTVSRSLYKSILRYTAFMHGRSYTVQPLPVTGFSIEEIPETHSLRLSWQPVQDPLEPTARPDGYIVYTAIDNLAFDNGIAVREPYFEIVPEKGRIYSFRVTASNAGGQSMPSETLSAYIARNSKGTILIVNGFQRLSGPATVETENAVGFDLMADAGVQHIASPVYSGYQQQFDRSHAHMADEEELGFSDDALDGRLIKGNSFDYPYIHGKAIAATREYSFVSCSREALETAQVSPERYCISDIILGLQKHTPNDTIMGVDYYTFSPELMQFVRDFTGNGGKLIVSGSYMGSDLASVRGGTDFARDILGFTWNGSIKRGGEQTLDRSGGSIGLTVTDDGETYRLDNPEIIEPAGKSIAILTYSNSHYCAATAYRDGTKGVVALGFPFESISGDDMRAKVMKSIVTFLTE